MKYIFASAIWALLILVSLSGCEKNDVSFPACLKAGIGNQAPVEIWEWRFAGEKYYYLVSPCCDQYNFLVDDNCEVVCAPDGGIAGNGDGTCPEFTGEVTKRLLWKNEN